MIVHMSHGEEPAGQGEAAPALSHLFPGAVGWDWVSHGDLGLPKKNAAGLELECCCFPQQTSPEDRRL